MAQRVDLDGEADVHALARAQHDHAVEQRFPILVAGEIVVGDEEALYALRIVLADDLFHVVGRAETALPALDVDDGAERALIGAAAAEIHARQRPRGATNVPLRKDRKGLALKGGKPFQAIVERLQRSAPGIAENLVEPAVLGLAGEQARYRVLGPREFRGAPRAAWQYSRRRGTRRGRPAARRQGKAGQDPRRGGTGSIGRQPGRSARGRPTLRIIRMMRSGRTRRLVSSYVLSSISTSGPRILRRRASSASPLRQASVLDGIAERSHWMG